MKIFAITLTVFLFFSCDDQTYYYLDKDTLFVFNMKDTLIYKGTSACDTFVVKTKSMGWRNVYKRANYQNLEVDIRELTGNAKDSAYDYSDGCYIDRDAANLSSIFFRNDFNTTLEKRVAAITYTIGKHTIKEVYKLGFQLPTKLNPKAVKTIYYNQKYGLIAYELNNGEIVELEEKYL
jgi:hypothetical protein